MPKKFFFLLGSLVFLAGCGAGGLSVSFHSGPPSTPPVVQAHPVGNSEVELHWSAVPGAAKYSVQQLGGKAYWTTLQRDKTHQVAVLYNKEGYDEKVVKGTSYTVDMSYLLDNSIYQQFHTFTFWVTPINGQGAGPHSAGVSVTLP